MENTNNQKHERKDERFTVTRRSFLAASAVAGAAVAANRILGPPKTNPLPVTRESSDGVITEELLNTSCLNCATRCAISVRVVNGKAVKITGNPLSLVSEGQICPRGHIGLQVLYDPNRITSPLMRTNPDKKRGADPGWVPITWSEAMSKTVNRLKSLRESGQPQKLLLFHGLNTTSTEDMLNRFAGAYGTPNIIPEGDRQQTSVRTGRWLADGNTGQIAYDLSRTRYILAFGADILESEKPLARNLRMWGKIRRENPNRAKVIVINPRYSVTAAKADRWLPINPGTHGAMAMGVAHVIISERLYNSDFITGWTSGFEEYRELALKQYSPERVAAITGLDEKLIRQLAVEFARTGPAIAWAGDEVSGWPNGTLSSYAIFCLNALVGSIDVPGGIIYQENPPYKALPAPVEDDISTEGRTEIRLGSTGAEELPAGEISLNRLANAILDSEPYPVDTAIGFNSNLNMSAPATRQWDEAMPKIPYYIHIAPFITEMAEYADIILPATTYLEEWAYDHSPPGSGFAEIKLKQPVVEPLYDTKSITDILFDIANRLGGTIARSFSRLGPDAQSFVRYRTDGMLPWDDFRENGVWTGPDYRYNRYDRVFNTPSGKFEFLSGNLQELIRSLDGESGEASHLPRHEEVNFLGDAKGYPLILATYQPLLNIENGNQNYPWAQEIFMVMHGYGWTNFVEINSKTAGSLGIRDRDKVWVESPFNKIKATARVTEGIHPGVVSIADGQGHYAGGQWQKGIGINPNEIIGADHDRFSGQAAFLNTRVRIYRA